jgi:proline iminopeptidase
MSPKLIVGGALALAVLLILAAAARRFMRAPLYTPGMVRAGANPGASLEAPAQGTDPTYWTVEEGVRLYHQAIGAGPLVLVIHGGPGIPVKTPWRALAPLAARYRFAFYDQRGCGRSTRPVERLEKGFGGMKALERRLGLGAQVADLERIRRITGQESMVLLGHSFGGLLAMLYAAEFPERVRALVLVAPADLLTLPAPDGGLFEQVRRSLPDAAKADYEAYLKRLLDFGGLARSSDAAMATLNAQFGSYYVQALKARGLPAPPDGGMPPDWIGGFMVPAMYLSMGQQHDYRPALAQVSAPALVLHGGRDLQPESASRRVAAALPHARTEVIAEAGHFAFDEAPEAFAAALEGFLGEQGIGER